MLVAIRDVVSRAQVSTPRLDVKESLPKEVQVRRKAFLAWFQIRWSSSLLVIVEEGYSTSPKVFPLIVQTLYQIVQIQT